MPSESKLDSLVAVVDGVRTPFAKRATDYAQLDTPTLASLCVSELVARAPVDPDGIDRVVFGQVVPPENDTNIARQVVLRCGLPRKIDAYSVSRACATSYQSAIEGVNAISMGEAECVVAGGADSMSAAPISFPVRLSQALQELGKAASLSERVEVLREIEAADLIPHPPEVADPFTKLRMGDAAEKMAKEFGISREAQDRFAHRSHERAVAAAKEGKLDDEVMTVYLPPHYEAAVARDNVPREDSDLEAYAKLSPAFDRRYGSVTAGNSSPLTDGAAALMLMHADRAKSLGAQPLGAIHAHAFVAVDPEDHMLMGPAYAIPLALERAGLELSDIDLLDMHEAFGAQVLAVVQALESDTFAREKLGRERRVGEVDWDKLNVSGGSIALGHPFAATGARQISQTLRELERRGGQFAVCSACAAGGLGAAIVLEVSR